MLILRFVGDVAERRETNEFSTRWRQTFKSENIGKSSFFYPRFSRSAASAALDRPGAPMRR
jgi:hypothetical protein